MNADSTPPTPSQEPPALSVLVKRGILYGAAAGMVVGLAYEATVGAAPAHPVVVWRNFILAGALIGLVAGLLFGIYICRRSEARIEDRGGDSQ